MRIALKFLVGAATAAFVGILALAIGQAQETQTASTATPAPAAFDDRTNGFLSQALFEENEEVFAEREEEEDGLGPVYNATACSDCHQNPVVGAVSQVTELRAGRYDGQRFYEHDGGSLIHDRAIHPDVQESLGDGYNVRALRSSLNTLGDGYVEAIADSTFYEIANSQPASMRGEIIRVPVLEANGALRVGRFGWKDQHASLESFSADAYLNEMGITSPLAAQENSSNGHSVRDYDEVTDPEDDGADIKIFADFMRSTKAPPRDRRLAATDDARAGSAIFNRLGCNTCHVRTIVTAPAGTPINGGAFVVPPALGNKIIHPFSDFLLHDIGTGDGIVQNGGPATRNKLRTAPLWGLRTHSRFMHDGESYTLQNAIRRHKGEAAAAGTAFDELSRTEEAQLLTFLRSL
jgi:CxxC motif-containing protein (DUF1111 family)